MNEPMDRQEVAKMVLRTQGSHFRFFTSPKFRFDQKKLTFVLSELEPN